MCTRITSCCFLQTKSIVGDADTDNLTEEADFSPHIQKYQKLLLEVVVHAVGTLPRKTDFLRVLLMPLHDLQALQVGIYNFILNNSNYTQVWFITGRKHDIAFQLKVVVFYCRLHFSLQCQKKP